MLYLDNSATTIVSEAAAKKMLEAATVVYGNPSSLHDTGIAAARMLKEARERIFSALGAKDGELIFTGSGSEANNLALFGVSCAKPRNAGGRIITDDSQHPSITEPLNRLASQGFEIVRIPTIGGKIDEAALLDAVTERTIMVTVMTVNNETGAIYDVGELFRAVKRKNPAVVTHTDAVQAFMKLPFTPASLRADLISISGHKVHAPKGIGALYATPEIIKNKKLVPYILGGGQENGFRSGTENVPGAAAFGEAVLTPFNRENCALRYSQLAENLPDGVRLNRPVKPSTHILSLTVERVKSETLLHFLSSRGIAVSSGSACSSHHGEKNRVLSAFGLDNRRADCTIRVSLGGEESESDISALLEGLDAAVKTLIHIR